MKELGEIRVGVGEGFGGDETHGLMSRNPSRRDGGAERVTILFLLLLDLLNKPRDCGDSI